MGIDDAERANVRTEYRAGRTMQNLRIEAERMVKSADARLRAVIAVTEEVKRAELDRSKADG